ncbi:MAG: hypothetical protein OXC44_04065, partial [Proteobacteria bacterium]|nr:hypothetical protein [Pseudomonadota bacterium]
MSMPAPLQPKQLKPELLKQEPLQQGQLRLISLYKSVQGESTRAGKPCVFVRLSGCPLRCRWCDSTYTFTGGKVYTLEAIVEE